MAKITEIKKLKRLYSVKFDEQIEDADGELLDKIYVTEDTIVKFMLSKGLDIDAAKAQKIIKFSDYSRGKNLAIYYISFKMRSRGEVAKYLTEHEIPETNIPQILTELEQIGLINDEKLVENFLEVRISGGQNGPYNLRQKLQKKEIDPDLVSEKLQQFYDSDKQLEAAIKLAEKQVRAKSARLPLKQLKIKIAQSLVGKGFSYETASNAVESLELEPDEENEQELLETEAEKAYTRLSKRYEGYDLKNRVSQTLGRKGFDWSAISDVLRDYDF
ncbi:MAG: recombination regulator RecX [Streptococcaceae bacterium]|jgi:regulatory protein|nr:recombination regulator RecX [Streptococcaceae bacterium]